MKKNSILFVTSVLVLVMSMFSVSALDSYRSYDSYDPYNYNSAYNPEYSSGSYYGYSPSYTSFGRPVSTYNSQTHYEETPGYTRFPTSTYSNTGSASTSQSNYDSTDSQYDYRGPLYEKTTVYTDDFLADKSSKSGFFTAKANDILQRSITSKTTEKYIGASESLTTNSQNRRLSTSDVQLNEKTNYDGGFSFGKQRLFDSNEYGRNSYSDSYYYRPYFNGNYFNWGW